MNPQDIDQEELEVFLDEVDELLQIMEEDIIKLEKQQDNPSILQEIFRAAHTMKGSGAAMGFTTLSKLAHSMETVFDAVRSGKLGISMLLIDTFLHCTDTIKALKEEIAGDLQESSSIEDHLKALEALLDGDNVSVLDEKDKKTKSIASEKNIEDVDEGLRTLNIQVEAGPHCGMPYVRALQVLTFFSEIGDIEDSSPTLEEIDSEQTAAFPLNVLLKTQVGESKIRETLSPITDVNLVGIEDGEVSIIVEAVPLESIHEETGDYGSEMEPVESDGDTLAEPEPPPESEEPAQTETEIIKVNPEAKPAPGAQKKNYVSRTVRVDVERMDTIMDLVGELVINRTRLSQLSRNLEAFYESDEDIGSLNETSDNIELISAQLQENIMKARLLPIENVFNKFPRMVRDLANKSNKKVELLIEGEKTELDRSVIEEIGDPLMHTIRNSIDHGIEPEEERVVAGKQPAGRLRIAASHVEDHIQIVIEDDGKGIALDKVLEKAKKVKMASSETLDSLKEDEILELIFAPGFSTADSVSEVSGRGVGMDVVRTNIEKLNGNIALKSTPGKGTKTIIKLPLTLAIVKALLVSLESRIFAIPIVSVVRTLRTEISEIRTVKGKETILFHNSVLPIVSLGEVFGIERNIPPPEKFFIVVISWGGKKVGIRVDSLIGDQEIVIRPLGEYIGEVPGISGAAILGDGKISLIVDIDGFIRLRRKEMELARTQ